MSEQSEAPGSTQRTELPIERGFPIERVNEIAEKEGRAKMYYRPIYTMHKWWARRLGCVFRAISLYTLLDDPEEVEVYEPGQDNETLAGWGEETLDIASLMDRVEMSDPESLWELYPKDVRVEDKKVLDPFMGGGTSLVEASRLGAEVVGNDLNPVAWFVTKKQLEAGQTDVEELEAAFEQVKEDVAEEITQYYRTPCPNGDHEADVMYYFWVKELDCTSCGENVPLFKDYRIGKGRYENKGSYNVLCPECESAIRIDNWQSKNACAECGHSFVPEEGNAGRGDYTCRSCGQKYGIVDAIQEQGGFDTRLYGLEYYCPTCDENDEEKGKIRSYKGIQERDIELTEKAKQRWEESEELREYIPDENIPLGIKTDSAAFEGSIGGGFNVLRHGYDEWADMFNERQLFALATLLKSIDELNDQNAKEYLLLAVSDALRTNCMMVSYDPTRNGMGDIFRSNSFNPPLYPAENNVWGSEYGRGTFKSSWEMVKSGVEYGRNPTDRVVTDGSPEETEPFDTRVGENFSLRLGDARTIPTENEYDAVITDPPYYDNVIYSELSDFFYIWLKILLEDEYEGFSDEKTPRTESIVANPAVGKGAEEFEDEITQAFAVVRDALKNDGILTFTYHHADSESWGELLNAICEVGFEVTATYPITADISKLPAKLGKGDSVSFDIIVVARPIEETAPASWKSLRREIYRTARRTRQQLEENRDLSRGDIGVMEMGACFREYSHHHGKVQRDGEIMDAKEVVQEIYGIIQEAGDIGVEDVFLDLLDSADPSFDDVNKLCRGTSATPEELKEMALYNQDDGFELGTWDNEKRQAYIQERTNGGDEYLSNLDKLQFLRYRYEKGQAVQNYVDKWGVDDNLRELAGRLADVTGDNTYTRVLGDRDITSY
jgi:adenine-specific DNA methylase